MIYATIKNVNDGEVIKISSACKIMLDRSQGIDVTDPTNNKK